MPKKKLNFALTIFFSVLIIPLLPSLSLSSTFFSQVSVGQETKVISNPSGDVYSMRAVQDRKGFVHIFMASGSNSLAHYKSTDKNGDVFELKDAISVSSSSNIATAMDGKGRIWLFYGPEGKICYRFSSDNGVTWSKEESISSGVSASISSAKKVSDNEIWLVLSKFAFIRDGEWMNKSYLKKFDVASGSFHPETYTISDSAALGDVLKAANGNYYFAGAYYWESRTGWQNYLYLVTYESSDGINWERTDSTLVYHNYGCLNDKVRLSQHSAGGLIFAHFCKYYNRGEKGICLWNSLDGKSWSKLGGYYHNIYAWKSGDAIEISNKLYIYYPVRYLSDNSYHYHILRCKISELAYTDSSNNIVPYYPQTEDLITGLDPWMYGFFNPYDIHDKVTISYVLDREAKVKVEIYDSSNKLVKTLTNFETKVEGMHSEIWSGVINCPEIADPNKGGPGGNGVFLAPSGIYEIKVRAVSVDDSSVYDVDEMYVSVNTDKKLLFDSF